MSYGLKQKGIGLAKKMGRMAADEMTPRPVPLPPSKTAPGPFPTRNPKMPDEDPIARHKEGRRNKARMLPYSMDGIDGRNDPPSRTMEYDPERDGTADAPIDNWDGEDPGFEQMGKQEYNKKWRYDNWRSEEKRPIPENEANVYNDLFDEGARSRPDLVNGNDTEIAQWERNVRRKAQEAGLSEDEIDDLINDLVDLD